MPLIIIISSSSSEYWLAGLWPLLQFACNVVNVGLKYTNIVVA